MQKGGNKPQRKSIISGWLSERQRKHDDILRHAAALTGQIRERRDMSDLVRQPDFMDGDKYTNIDIAKRMWETYNVCGDRWFKFAAERLEAHAVEGMPPRTRALSES